MKAPLPGPCVPARKGTGLPVGTGQHSLLPAQETHQRPGAASPEKASSGKEGLPFLPLPALRRWYKSTGSPAREVEAGMTALLKHWIDHKVDMLCRGRGVPAVACRNHEDPMREHSAAREKEEKAVRWALKLSNPAWNDTPCPSPSVSTAHPSLQSPHLGKSHARQGS